MQFEGEFIWDEILGTVNIKDEQWSDVMKEVSWFTQSLTEHITTHSHPAVEWGMCTWSKAVKKT